MAPGGQDSRSSATSSNADASHAWRQLGQACRDVIGRRPADGAAARILELAVAATGAERAFVVCSGGAGGVDSLRIRASHCRRQDGVRTPSRTVLLRSLAGRRVLILSDVRSDAALASGASVAGLGLRFVVSAPLEARGCGRAALVLDSRGGPAAPIRETREILEAFAALLSLILGSGSEQHATDAWRLDDDLEWVGRSAAFRDLTARATRAAPWPLPVLVTGESGSGKEGVARLLHAGSPRRGGPFVTVNCAAITETLLESELFGAIRGAYTGLDRDRAGLFRRADGGTLLLDEVGDMSPGMQAKLLRTLQDQRVRPVGGDSEAPVDVRVVAATHRDLRQCVIEGRFRQDLYYRLGVLALHVPALRERTEDIPLLVRHIGLDLAQRAGRRAAPSWSAEALARLAQHDWPGNIRELQAVVARTLVNCDADEVEVRHLDLPPSRAPDTAGGGATGLEARMIEAALRRSGGVVSHAASCIGWSRQKLSRRMIALRIPRAGNAS
jgi:DNA-binding NtrC family response regulator